MINIFKIVSFLEGVSYILLLGLGMYYKYFLNDPTYVKMFGMPHGVLFIAYIILAIILKYQLKWTGKTFSIICLLSLLPFGTFFVGKYLKS
ncbi:DUF3817 domain-containing protein [Tenacibaculum sp. nBUS_03]|uniref:DUF3817 domain-containing protein n=1 Tax=Tenacibaculum sp. nBUS_03 TaxID=3395320 RepID=UPI003EBBF742